MCAVVRNNPKKILGYPSFASNYAGSRSEIKGGPLLCHAGPDCASARLRAKNFTGCVARGVGYKLQVSSYVQINAEANGIRVCHWKSNSRELSPPSNEGQAAPVCLIKRPRSPDYLRQHTSVRCVGTGDGPGFSLPKMQMPTRNARSALIAS